MRFDGRSVMTSRCGGAMVVFKVLLLFLVAVVSDTSAAAGTTTPTRSSTAACVSGGVTGGDSARVLAACFMSLQANLSARGLVSASIDNATDIFGVLEPIAAFEPLLNYLAAAVISRWPSVLGPMATEFNSTQATWSSASGAFALFCRDVAGPFSQCAVDAASPLCPSDVAKVRGLMSAWASRYCDMSRLTPRGDVLARLQRDFVNVTSAVTCLVNGSGAGAVLRNDLDRFLNGFLGNCLNPTALSLWFSQFIGPLYMSSDIFTAASSARRSAMAMARCALREYDSYCPGSVDKNWATLTYLVALMVGNVTGAVVTPADLAWRLPPLNVGAAAERAVVAAYGSGWYVSAVGGKRSKCVIARGDSSLTEALITNKYQTVTRTLFSSGGAKGQVVSVTFNSLVNASAGVTLGSYAFTAYVYAGILTANGQLYNAAGKSVTGSSLGTTAAGGGWQTIVTVSTSASGVISVDDRRAGTVIRLFANKYAEVATVVRLPKTLFDRSFGNLAHGCLSPIPNVVYQAPKVPCLKQCPAKKPAACSYADCAIVSAYKDTGEAVVDSMLKF